MSSDWDAITAAYDELDAAQARVAEFSYDALTVRELLVLVGRRETDSVAVIVMLWGL